jgi:hypothetical protein
LGQANVPECAVGFLFLSFILFTVVILALAVTISGFAIGRVSEHKTVNQHLT